MTPELESLTEQLRLERLVSRQLRKELQRVRSLLGEAQKKVKKYESRTATDRRGNAGPQHDSTAGAGRADPRRCHGEMS